MEPVGLKICDYCGEPLEVHVGFDHRNGKCLLAADALMLAIKFPNPEKRVAVILAVNEFRRTNGGISDDGMDTRTTD